MTADFVAGMDLINTSSREKLLDRHFLENDLLFKLGLNDEMIDEQPARFAEYYGKGFGWKIWQYPNQFADYLLYLARHAHKINSYLEVGCRHGGTFAITVCYLKRLNPAFDTAVAIDIDDEPPLLTEMKKHLPVAFLKMNSKSQEFRDYMNIRRFDLTFIDGDHSFDGVYSDFLRLKGKSKYLVFHDVRSSVCPGVVLFWTILKSFWDSSEYRIEEYIQQYEDTPAAGNFLGIGVVECV